MRARFTAYKYRLPDYLIATTDPTSGEWREDRKAWKTELLHFCDTLDYNAFRAGAAGEAGTNEAGEPLVTAPFRATVVPKGTLNLMDVCETSTLVQREGRWFYARGDVSYDSPQEYADE